MLSKLRGVAIVSCWLFINRLINHCCEVTELILVMFCVFWALPSSCVILNLVLLVQPKASQRAPLVGAAECAQRKEFGHPLLIRYFDFGVVGTDSSFYHFDQAHLKMTSSPLLSTNHAVATRRSIVNPPLSSVYIEEAFPHTPPA